MRRMITRWTMSAQEPDEGVLRDVANLIKAGRVVAYPTDTLYGLAVDPVNHAAVARLFTIKGREAARAVPLIAASLEQVENFVGTLSPLARALGTGFWPGPLTLILPAPSSLPPALLAEGTTIAVRVPAHPVAAGLARLCGYPVTSTSANRSGEPATADPDVVADQLGPVIDGLIDTGGSPGGLPSTLVDVTAERPRLVRAGAVPWERVVQFLPS
jgi:L-threonylcarbamoyladenylate synthase